MNHTKRPSTTEFPARDPPATYAHEAGPCLGGQVRSMAAPLAGPATLARSTTPSESLRGGPSMAECLVSNKSKLTPPPSPIAAAMEKIRRSSRLSRPGFDSRMPRHAKQVQANAPPLANRRGHGVNQAKFKVELVQSMTINLGSTTAQVRKADHCQWR